MIMPSRISCSPRSTLSRTAVCAMMPVLAPRVDHRRRTIVDLDARRIAKSADHFVAAGDDLIALLNAVQYFDIRGARDTRLNFAKLRAAICDHEHALDFFVPGF